MAKRVPVMEKKPV